jgi:hypothetical protein
MLNLSSSLNHVILCEKDEADCSQCQAIKTARDPDLYEKWEGFEGIHATRYVSDSVKRTAPNLFINE